MNSEEQLSAPLSYDVHDIDIERFRDFVQHIDGWVPFSALDTGQIGLVDTRTVGKLFLRHALFAPQPLKVEPDSLLDVHAGMRRAGLTLTHRL